MNPPNDSCPEWRALAGELRRHPRRWLVTGSAGFIGSHLVETLLSHGQQVVGLDNYATGHRRNDDEVRAAVGEDAWRRCALQEGDIADPEACRRACRGVDVVLHHAALGSVPRSIAEPLRTHAANATGFVNMLVAAQEAGVQRIVYASSSAVYGDRSDLPMAEDVVGRPLSPYAVTKYADELYADVFARWHALPAIGLRYFNVYGPRQDPEGDYAAVIPRWIACAAEGRPLTIYGDGSTTRDFCHVDDVVGANLLAAATTRPEALNQVFNVASGKEVSLLELLDTLRECVGEWRPGRALPDPVHADFRPGDVRRSLADIGKARRLLGFVPRRDMRAALMELLTRYDRPQPAASLGGSCAVAAG